jgi:hypothetical protein
MAALNPATTAPAPSQRRTGCSDERRPLRRPLRFDLACFTFGTDIVRVSKVFVVDSGVGVWLRKNRGCSAQLGCSINIQDQVWSTVSLVLRYRGVSDLLREDYVHARCCDPDRVDVDRSSVS